MRCELVAVLRRPAETADFYRTEFPTACPIYKARQHGPTAQKLRLYFGGFVLGYAEFGKLEHRFSMRFLTALLLVRLAFVLSAADLQIPGKPAAPPRQTTAQDVLNPEKSPRPDLPLLGKTPANWHPLVAGPNDGKIATLVASDLERYHYLQIPFNNEVSSRFLDRYLAMLDSQRIHFLQSDLAEFERYRTLLDDLIVGVGDTSPADLIFNRFVQRLEQRVACVNELLATEQFEFNTDEHILLNRKNQSWPKDMAEAKTLWRDRLRYEILQEKLNTEKPEEIVKIITRRYARTLRTVHEFDSDDVLQIYLTALTHAYDPHSDYFGRAQSENFAISMKLSLFGIGALLSSEDGYCKIKELMPGPAQRSKKLKPNDRIIAVAQGANEPVDAVDMKLNKVVDMIRGPKDTEVRLTIIPADAADPSVREVVSLIRDEIKLEDQQAKARIIDMPAGAGHILRLGVIDLPSFYADFDSPPTLLRNGNSERKSTTADVAKLLRKLKLEKVAGIVLDLRRNGGGSLEEAINLTGLFIKQGPVVQIKGPDGGILVDRDTDPSVLYDGPLIVLTSRFSASASEILAGALQDYGRALIVGDSSTHGKGTVQSLVQLGPQLAAVLKAPENLSPFNPGSLKVTIRKFYRASGSSTQLEGVTPDLILPSVNNYAEVGESSLDNPMPWDKVLAVSFEKLSLVQPFLAELQKLSAQRVATDKDFAYVREDIEQFKKVLAEKSISLNEEIRRKEKLEAEARSGERKKELQARHEPEQKIYEITLKLAEQPGLPPPLAKTNIVASADGKKTGATLPATAGQPVAQNRKSSGDDPDGQETSSPDDPTARDITLEEAKRILVDYVTLINRDARLTLKN